MRTLALMQTLTCLALGCIAAPVVAQQGSDVHPELTSKFDLAVGIYYPKREYVLSVDGSLGEITDPIDFDAALGTDDKDPLLTGIFSWQFKEKWSLGIQHFSAGQTTNRSLEEEIEWEDIIYEVGADVRLETGFDVTRLFVARHFLQDPKHDLGVGFGVHAINVKLQIQGAARLDDESTEFRDESANMSAPLPNLGVWYRYSPSKKWLLGARVDWLSVSIDDISGSLTDIRLSADYSFNDHFGMGLAYQEFRLDADHKNDIWRGSVKVDFTGPSLVFKAYW